ncbi:MAG: hypothetical protein Q7W45_10405 [Bacteroidota bacterium]|nr:hypothetical protein [Bacteroidota bacterium]MDP3146324.1 hypothetical protein [Bacteroidota bacterium]
MKDVNLNNELLKLKHKTRSKEDDLLQEANRILTQDLFSEKKILNNLKHYNNSFEIIDEEDVPSELIFKISEIKKIALNYRLKFIDSQYFKSEIPYEAILKIKDINSNYRKDIKGFKILGPIGSFKKGENLKNTILFAPTNYGNYYLIHNWGTPLKWHRKITSWPLKNFDNLFLSVIMYTLIITLSIPTPLITLDSTATYWSGYRAAAFMHLLIFHLGVTAYITFTFAKNLSSIAWNHFKDFG